MVELSDNQIVQPLWLNFLVIRKFNPTMVELSEVELIAYTRHVDQKTNDRAVTL